MCVCVVLLPIESMPQPDEIVLASYTSSKVKRQSTQWGKKYLQIRCLMKNLNPECIRIYTNNNNKTTQIKRLWQVWLDISLKKIYKWFFLHEITMPLLIREMQRKTTMRFHIAPIRMIVINKIRQLLEFPFTVSRNFKWSRHFEKQFGSFTKC